MAKAIRAALSPEERALFDKIVSDPRYLDVATPHLVARVREILLATIETAKADLAMPFGGYYPSGNEFGIGDLRPLHMGASVTWRINQTSTGWQDFLADKTTKDDLWIILWELENEEPVPKSTDLYLKVGVTTLPILDLRRLKMQPEARVPLPDPIVLGPETPHDSDVRIESTGYDGLRFVGCVITTGNNLIKKGWY